MCGIWGVFSRNKLGLFPKDIQIAKTMMILTQLRGADSTGVACATLKPNSPARVIKGIGGPNFLTQQGKAWDDFEEIVSTQGKALFGHGRAATVGAIRVKNAHPFKEKGLTFVHNGTIRKGLELTDEVEVDSHALCISIEKQGIVKALEDIDGAWAFFLHDAKDNSILFGRNTERPLFFFERGDMIYFMSSKESLQFVLEHHDVGYNVWPKELSANDIMRFDLETGGVSKLHTMPTQFFFKPPIVYNSEEEIAEPKVPPKVTYHVKQEKHQVAQKFVGEVVGFVVERCIKVTQTLFRWECLGELVGDKNAPRIAVSFYVKSCDIDYLNMWGEATIRSAFVEKESKEEQYVVAHKDIVWEPVVIKSGTKEVTEKEKPFLSTRFGKTITKKVWDNRSQCACCQETLPEDAYKKSHVTATGKVVCEFCIDDLTDFCPGENIEYKLEAVLAGGIQ